VGTKDSGGMFSRPNFLFELLAHSRPKDGVASLAYVPEKWTPVSEKDMLHI
jgi:hypothetical protein